MYAGFVVQGTGRRLWCFYTHVLVRALVFMSSVCPQSTSFKDLYIKNIQVFASNCQVFVVCWEIQIRVVKLLLFAYYYYYYYYFIYLNSLLLLLLLLRRIFKQPITITITITSHIRLLLLLEILRKPITITITSQTITITITITITFPFIITVEPKKHNTSRLQSNIQRPLLLPLYHTLPTDTLQHIISL